MVNDVFICYSPENEDVAEDICNLFEDNNHSCWFKKRDYGENDTVLKISESLRNSKCMVLVYSKDAANTNFIVTETDIAFSSEVPIIIFSVDDSEIGSKLHFYLKDKPKIDAYPDTDSYYGTLLEDAEEFLQSSQKHVLDGENEAYICYDERDVLTAEAICHVLEENGIKCWFKKRDLKVNETVQKVTESIKSAKSLVLVYSKDSINSNYVKSETGLASSSNIPIVSFKIEDVEKSEDLKDAHWLDAYPNPENKFKDLVSDVGNLIGKPVKDPKITKKFDLKKVDKTEENKTEYPKVSIDESSKDFSRNYGFGKNFKIIIAVVVIIAAIALAGVYFSTNGFTFLGDNQITMSDDGVSISQIDDDTPVSILQLAILTTDLGSKKCTAVAKLYEEPDNFDDYTVNAKYYDGSGNLIGESSVPMKNIERNGDTFTIIDYVADDKVESVSITVLDDTGSKVFHTKISSS